MELPKPFTLLQLQRNSEVVNNWIKNERKKNVSKYLLDKNIQRCTLETQVPSSVSKHGFDLKQGCCVCGRVNLLACARVRVDGCVCSYTFGQVCF